MRKGWPFMLVAREINLRHPGRSSLNANCPPATGLDPGMLEAVRDLGLGETSPPFTMRTIDRHRRRGQSLFELGNYAKAEEALLEDLRLHPASSASSPGIWWPCTGSRAATKESSLRAFDQALLFAIPRDAAILNGKASALSDLGRAAEAQTLYEDALRLDQDSPTLKANLA